ncbi:MAG: substrate-binding domain-containing protein [Hyphomonadaceae bacterium]|nr:substrate-binding domain-containing protein [Hyphomonadaceae bacterium]
MPKVRLPSERVLAAGLLLAVAVAGSWPAAASETVRVLAAGAAQGAVLRLEPALAAASAARLDAVFDTVGALRDRVLRGEVADVVILSEAGLAALEKAGKIAAAAAVDLGSIAVALAVRKGAPALDVTSADALKQALLSAASIAHADPARGATAGAHFAGVLERLGIAAEVRTKVVVLPFGGEVIAEVARGRFEIGVSQSSEIVAHPGVILAGPLPHPYGHRTRYLAAKLAGAPARADAVLAVLQTAAARAVFAELGFEMPR